MSIESFGDFLGDTLSLAGGLFDISDDDERYYDSAGATADAQAEVARESARLAREQWDRYKRIHGPLEEARTAEALREMGLFAPLKDAQTAEALRDISLYRPLKEAEVGYGLGSLGRRNLLEERLTGLALEGEEPDYNGALSRAEADVRRSYAAARDAGRRRMSGLGLDPSRLAWMEGLADLEEAGVLTAARTRARDAERVRAEERSLGLLSAALSASRGGASGLPRSSLSVPLAEAPSSPAASAMGLLSAASGGLASAAGNYAGLARTMEQREQSRAKAGAQILGEVLDLVF